MAPFAVRVDELGSRPIANPSPLRVAGTAGPAIVLLAHGAAWLESGSSPQYVKGPSLVLLTDSHGKLRLESGARGYLIVLGNSVARLQSAREPAFRCLFTEARAASLEAATEDFGRLEATLAAMASELALPAAARLTAVEAHLQLFLTGVLRILERASPGLRLSVERAAGRPAQLVAEFLRLADTHCRHRWSLSDYARALHVSPGYLRAACARETGAAPVRLIHECLLREAQRHLITTLLPIGAIARELGFEDAAYFSRLFHAKIGVSPRQYRLALRQHQTAVAATAAR